VKREVESESEDELMMKPVKTTPTKKPPTKAIKKNTSHLPSPARSTSSTSSPSRTLEETDSSSDDDEVAKLLTDSPKRKRAAAASTTKQLLTPQTTPPKKRSASSSAPKTSSPLKQSITPAKRKASAVLSGSEEEEDELASRSARKPQTPRKTPTKSKPVVTPTKVTPTASALPRAGSSTPSRSSLRKQRLPPNLAEIKNAPKELRNRLVGFHMEDEGYGVNAESKEENVSEEEEEEVEVDELEAREQRRREKGKGRAIDQAEVPEVQDDSMQVDDQDESSDPFFASTEQQSPAPEDYTLPTPPSIFSASAPTNPNSRYQSSFLHRHIERQLSVLTGASLPEARLDIDAAVPSFDRSKGVLGYPFLEGGYSEWEKPLRGTLNEVVTRGMGNAVVLLGPRGVGKTMVSFASSSSCKFAVIDDFLSAAH